MCREASGRFCLRSFTPRLISRAAAAAAAAATTDTVAAASLAVGAATVHLVVFVAEQSRTRT